jgi:penicillin G amidase
MLRLTAGALAVIFFLVLAALLWYWQASAPQHVGRVAVSGIDAVLRIERDRHGVPHIVAASERDAAFGLGYAHAQDRLWQMEMNRRIAAGRLAEVLGVGALETDRFLRTIGIRHTAEAIYRQLDDGHRGLLDAYSAGVNAQLATRSGPLPPEFLLTRAPAPEPWTGADSIGWSLMMAWDLARYSMVMELRRLHLAQHFSVDEINEIYPPYPGESAPPAVDYAELYRLLGIRLSDAGGSALATGIPGAGSGLGDAVGSNAWVISGSRTTSGRPLLANDPHLGLSAPAVWYFAALSAPGLNVIGATLPGVPGVILGRNDRVAWSFTNAGADQLDVYIERLRPDDSGQYQTPDGWAPFAIRHERIGVKGGDDVELIVRSTRHGPVMSGLPGFDRALKPERYVLALRWSALDHDDRTMVAIAALNRAGSVDEAEHALRWFDLVTQAALLADVDGDIGLVLTGRVPLRSPDSDLRGIAPAPGWDPRHDWQGYLPQAAKPRLRNPPAGFIVTANHKLGEAPYPHHLTYDWFLPFRANRITERIGERAQHDAASVQTLQADVVSLAARELIGLLRETQPATAAGRDALERLAAWDGAMRRDAPEPLLFHAWMRELKRRIFADDFGPLTAAYIEAAEVTPALLHVLSGRARARDWCDDRATPHRFENCIALAADALDTAVAALTQASGLDVAALRWGEVHEAVAQHRPFSSVRFLARLFEQRIAYPGDTYTVNVGALTHDPDAPFSTRHAASLRAIYDLAAPAEGSAWMLSSGQSGSPLSRNYAAMLLRWRDVEYLPMRPALKTEASVLELVPAAR